MASTKILVTIEKETADQMDYIKSRTGAVYQFQATRAITVGVRAEYNRLKSLNNDKKNLI